MNIFCIRTKQSNHQRWFSIFPAYWIKWDCEKCFKERVFSHREINVLVFKFFTILDIDSTKLSFVCKFFNNFILITAFKELDINNIFTMAFKTNIFTMPVIYRY